MDFVFSLKAALESELTSLNLNHWIDLNFGFKLTGELAQQNCNVYHEYAYAQQVDWDLMYSSLKGEAIKCLIQEYGVVPFQLFFENHPKKKIKIINPKTKENEVCI